MPDQVIAITVTEEEQRWLNSVLADDPHYGAGKSHPMFTIGRKVWDALPAGEP